ncbi:MAG TPA: hypothetical protein VM285_08380 [Polyangia bacterium]|nr:hypothetical protein [Polyangia bacterium]
MRASLLVALALLFRPAAAVGDDDALRVTVMPGESRVISHALSAARDTALMGYQVLPHVVLTTGADFAFLGFRFAGVDLRTGMFGLIEVQTLTEQPGAFLYVPSGPYLWRGLLGYSVAAAFEEPARRLLGPRGALEVAVSFRHESEHWTGSGRDEALGARFAAVPNVGDFVMPEGALRAAAGPVDVELRAQCKVFLPTYDSYSVGPGVDLIFRWRLVPWIHPFLSLFAEDMVGDVDNYLARGLLGVVFPGEVADIQIFAAAAHGRDKGLLALHRDTQLGWGIRIGLFKNREE